MARSDHNRFSRAEQEASEYKLFLPLVAAPLESSQLINYSILQPGTCRDKGEILAVI
jgi:hypothetical protein